MKTFLDCEKESVQIYFKKSDKKQIEFSGSTPTISKSWNGKGTASHRKIHSECYLLFPVGVFASVLSHDNRTYYGDNLKMVINKVFSETLPSYVYNINYSFETVNNYMVIHMGISVKFNSINHDDVPLSDKLFVKFLHDLRDRFIENAYGVWYQV